MGSPYIFGLLVREPGCDIGSAEVPCGRCRDGACDLFALIFCRSWLYANMSALSRDEPRSS